MKTTIDALIRGRLAPVLAGVLGLIYLVFIGFRGIDEATLQWLERCRQLAIDVADDAAAISDWSHESVALIDLFGGFFYLLLPTGWEEWGLFVVSVLAGTLATAMVFECARRLAGAVGGWLSLFFLLTCAPWLGVFTRLDPTFAVVPVVLGVVLVWYERRFSWWLRALVGAPLIAAAVLLWPGAVMVVALLVMVDLLVPPFSEEAPSRGLFNAPTIEVDRLVTPLAALALLLAYPLFWPSPLEGLGEYLIAAVDQPPAQFVFRGEAYPPARPPFYTGAAWVFEQLPLALVVALATGIIWSFLGLRTAHRRMAVGCAAITTGLLCLPVVVRNPRPFDVDFTALVVALGVPVASLLICRFFTHALGRGAPSKKIRQIAVVGFLLAGGSVIIEAPRALQSPESFRSPMSARLTGWSATGDMPMRQEILPLQLIEDSGADRNTGLYTGGWEPYLDVYKRMRLFDELATTEDPAAADVAIRPVPAISAGRFSTHPAAYPPALERANTEVVPEIHRPLFFVDRRE